MIALFETDHRNIDRYYLVHNSIKKEYESENVIAQIEHIEGVNNLDKIISTKRIDTIIVVPYDLSDSLGFPGEFDREDVKKALVKVKEICLNANFPMGYHVVAPDVELVNSTISEGYSFIAFSTDFYFMGDTANKLMQLIPKDD